MIDSMAAYLDLAKEATSTKTDSNLARKIGVTRTYIGQMRHGTRLPSEQLMLALATRANLDRQEALILLNLWKAEGEAKTIYKSLLLSHLDQAKDGLKKFSVTSALVFCLSLAPLGENAQAFEYKQDLQHFSAKTLSHNAQSNKHYTIFDRIKTKIKRLLFKIFKRPPLISRAGAI